MARRVVVRKKKSIMDSFGWISFFLILVNLIMFGAGILTGYYISKRAETKAEDIYTTDENQTPAPLETPEETLQKEVENKLQKIMQNMTLSDMVYQMLFVTPESITKIGTAIAAGETTKMALEKHPVGGLIYFSKNFESREQTIEMIANSQSYSKIPLFIGVDEEGGKVSRLGSNEAMGTTKHPPMKEIGESGDTQKAYNVGKTLAGDLKALGFNVDFAPDADVLVNPNNTEIGDRSFGTDATLVADMVENVVKGLQENGISAALKHFPGHGSTDVDSHTGYSSSTRTLDEMKQAEFLPFQAGINADVDFIMISHMTPVNVVTEKVPASVSKEIITDILLNDLQYKGIIITDSFSMGAVTEQFSAQDAAVRAVKAGVDMILMPADLEGAHNALVEAVNNGEISKERIEASVRKILILKVKKQLIQ